MLNKSWTRITMDWKRLGRDPVLKVFATAL